VTYRVKEIFPTLQGEGAHSGRAAVFLRFSGCNLWNGRLEDRDTATCKFCDTDFRGTDGECGGEYTEAVSLAETVASLWLGTTGKPYVVVTGGEPLLQLDAALIEALHERGFEIAIETNGSLPVPEGVDWICVSPKEGARWIQKSGHELKVVWPQVFDLQELASLEFHHRFLQPMDDPDVLRRADNILAATRVCMTNPVWRLSLQTHKLIGIP
jgi:7-carboxy-7-deazaguanine synthase (Cx14CxxC type)